MAIDQQSHFTTGELGDFLGIQSWKVTRLFERGIIADPPRVGGRRLISSAQIPIIVEALRKQGWLSPASQCEQQGVDDE